jgi:hypothetical protein
MEIRLTLDSVSRWKKLTYHSTVREEQLVELSGEGSEQAPQGRDQASHHRRQPRRLSSTQPHRDGRDEQTHA